ncbi:MAG: hypothetical protein JXR05_05055 [Flavobacteriaceae bacterium]
MFGRNREIKLFKEIRIDSFLDEKEREIQNKIGRYSDHALISLNIEKEIQSLIGYANLKVPKLRKEETTSNITTQQMNGQQLPSGTRYQMGKTYDIEVANYSIPYTGNGEFLKCQPSNTTNHRPIIVEKQENSILIKLTNWLQGITGNDKGIEEIKAELIKNTDIIESELELLRNDIQEYIPVLEKRIELKLKKLIEKVNLKNDSNDKLNPFV